LRDPCFGCVEKVESGGARCITRRRSNAKQIPIEYAAIAATDGAIHADEKAAAAELAEPRQLLRMKIEDV
jgi:hypothetical protein